jgi:hypothetical protein
MAGLRLTPFAVAINGVTSAILYLVAQQVQALAGAPRLAAQPWQLPLSWRKTPSSCVRKQPRVAWGRSGLGLKLQLDF